RGAAGRPRGPCATRGRRRRARWRRRARRRDPRRAPRGAGGTRRRSASGVGCAPPPPAPQRRPPRRWRAHPAQHRRGDVHRQGAGGLPSEARRQLQPAAEAPEGHAPGRGRGGRRVQRQWRRGGCGGERGGLRARERLVWRGAGAAAGGGVPGAPRAGRGEQAAQAAVLRGGGA
ncbi:unnamed protein product, partial [Prorocentrum cordatum]